MKAGEVRRVAGVIEPASAAFYEIAAVAAPLPPGAMIPVPMLGAMFLPAVVLLPPTLPPPPGLPLPVARLLRRGLLVGITSLVAPTGRPRGTLLRLLPPPGESFDRYEFDPLAPIPTTGRRDAYYTPGPERRQRCGR